MLLGCKNKNFSYIKAKPTKKFGHNGFLRGQISTDHAELRGFAKDDLCLGHISCFHCFTQTHAAAGKIIRFQRREAISIEIMCIFAAICLIEV